MYTDYLFVLLYIDARRDMDYFFIAHVVTDIIYESLSYLCVRINRLNYGISLSCVHIDLNKIIELTLSSDYMRIQSVSSLCVGIFE